MGAWLRSKARPGVAPYTGAWIEIFSGVCTSFDDGSLPTRERGLKFLLQGWARDGLTVAPYTGAWIEIGTRRRRRARGMVAPYTGAWIEMSIADGAASTRKWSLPTRERGLKLCFRYEGHRRPESLPTRERGLK